MTGKVAAFAPHAKIIHIDIDPASISKNIKVDIPVVGDARLILSELNRLVERRDRAAWFEKIDAWRTKHPLVLQGHGPQAAVRHPEDMRTSSGDNVIVATEVGQNQMWAAQWFTLQEAPDDHLLGRPGHDGLRLPGGNRRADGRPDAVVWDIAGDGSIQMNIQELATAVGYKVPVKVAILNNGYLGMVRQWQELFFNRRYSSTDIAYNNPDFVKVAEA